MSEAPSSEVLPIFAQRWSPYRFEPRAIEDAQLQRCFDAARWAASSYNDQPWYFIVARRDQEAEFQRALQCLVEPNQVWAQHVGALVLTVIRTRFRQNDKPNRVALHDLGAAAAHFALQAAAEGLQAHQMGGVNLSQVRAAYQIPDGFEPQTAIAIGYPDTGPSADDDPLAQRDAAPRRRQALSDFVFTGRWEQPAWQ